MRDEVPPRWLGEQEIGEIVRGIRRRHGLTQQQFAERIGYPTAQSQISAAETGRERPSTDMLIAIAELDGQSVDIFRPRVALYVAPEEQDDPSLVASFLRQIKGRSARRVQVELEKLVGRSIHHSQISRWRAAESVNWIHPDTRQTIESYLSAVSPQLMREPQAATYGEKKEEVARLSADERGRILEYLDRETHAAGVRAAEATAALLRAQVLAQLAGMAPAEGVSVVPASAALSPPEPLRGPRPTRRPEAGETGRTHTDQPEDPPSAP